LNDRIKYERLYTIHWIPLSTENETVRTTWNSYNITHIFFKDNKIICKGQINLQILIFLVPSCPSSHLLYILVYQKRKIVLVLHLGKHFSSNSRSQSLTRKKFKEFKFLLNFVRISQSCSDTIPTISKH